MDFFATDVKLVCQTPISCLALLLEKNQPIGVKLSLEKYYEKGTSALINQESIKIIINTIKNTKKRKWITVKSGFRSLFQRKKKLPKSGVALK